MVAYIGNQLGWIVQAFLDNAVCIGFRCLVDELAEQPLAMRGFLFEPLHLILMMLGEPGRGDGCQGTDGGAGQRREGRDGRWVHNHGTVLELSGVAEELILAEPELSSRWRKRRSADA